MEKESVSARAERAEQMVAKGMHVMKACRAAGIYGNQFYSERKKRGIVPAVASTPIATERKSLIGRLLASNLSADDKIALLAAAYN